MTLYYEKLTENIKQLKNIFFIKNEDRDFAGNYSDEQKLKVAAYLTLVHAEFEHYYEKICFETAKNSVIKFKQDNIFTLPILGLLAFSIENNQNKIITIKTAIDKSQNSWNEFLLLKKKVQKSFDKFNYICKNNHGIKRENLLSLLLPIGFPIDESTYNLSFFDIFEKFGITRGEIVHHSWENFVSHERDPFECEDLIQKLLDETEKIDLVIENLTQEFV